MKLLIFSYLIFVNFTVLSADKDCAELKSGEVSRIDGPDGSLFNFSVQDQDGLGTCYANATSVMLKSALANHPDVSYLQIASIMAEKNISQDKSQAPAPYAQIRKTSADPSTMINDEEKWNLAVNGARPCEAFDALKELQKKNNSSVLCPKNKTNLEMSLANGDWNNSAFKTHLATSKYIDLFHEKFQGPNSKTNYENFKKDLSNIINIKKENLTNKECKKINAEGLESVMHPLLPKVLQNTLCFSTADSPSTHECKIIKAIAPDAELKNQFKITASAVSSSLMSKFNEILQKPHKEYSIDQMKSDFNNALTAETHLPLSEIEAAKISDLIPSEKLEDLISEFNEIKKTGSSSKCVDRLLLNYLTDSRNFVNPNEKGFQCENQGLLIQASQVALEYDRSGFKDLTNIIDFLNNKAGLSFHDAMRSLYANDCKDDDKIKIPENLNCKMERVYSGGGRRKEIDHLIFDNLKKNRALNINICASFIDKKDAPSILSPDCGHHALTIKGLKCVNGHYKYLIQNSWGKDSVAKNPDIETEKGTGAYWFNEETFYDSANTITTLIGGDQ